MVHCGSKFVKDKVFAKTTNWRCSFITNGRYSCKARAITRIFNNCEMVRFNRFHNHSGNVKMITKENSLQLDSGQKKHTFMSWNE